MKERQKRQVATARRSVLVAPILIACSLAMGSYMAFGYTYLHEDPTFSEASTQQDEASSGDGTYNQTEDPVGSSLISEYTAASSSEEPGRIENIKLASEAIDGTVLYPGESFSFNEIVGDVEHDERYELAPIVNGSELIYGRGGGTCQVSSALYAAALSSNLTIVERHAHSTVVDYAVMGLDATVVYGSLDLKIANETNYPVMIQMSAEGQTVVARIYGQALDDGLYIEPVPTLVEYHQAGTPVPNALEWDPVLESTEYYVVEVFREYYHQGAKTESVLISRDRYEVLGDTTVRAPNESLDSTK